jgi:NADPH-dependent curcumin reductase CurA
MDAINHRIVLAERPEGIVGPTTTRIEESPLPEIAEGEALVKVQYLSVDPAIRGWMNDAPGYLPPIGIGEVIRSGGVGEVIESRNPDYEIGNLVYGMTGWQEYVVAGGGLATMEVLAEGIEPTLALGVLGVTGITAYFGLLDVGAMKEGDTVVVSGAAGATGSTAGQIAKIKGAGSVIGIAGSDDKCAFIIDELGFDEAINYKTERVGSRLRELAPKGVDLYFDNVGGKILDQCLARLAMRGRIVCCGAISSYNDVGRPEGIFNYSNLIIRRGRMEGFIVFDFASRYAEARAALLGWVRDGRLHHAEHIVDGLSSAPDALNLLFSGGNTGKVLVKV